MNILAKLKQKYGFAPGAGFVETFLPSVRFFWSTETVERAPLLYSAGLVLVLQGHKTGWLGERSFHYDPEHYLVLSIPVPFECETLATPESPLLGLFLDIDRIALTEFVSLLGEPKPKPHSLAQGVLPVRLGAEMREAVERLMRVLTDEVASKALGKGILREILFHALSGPHGLTLRAMAETDSRFERISQSIITIRKDYAQQIRIEDLASEAAMSVPSYYRAFKTVTGSSPYQYLQATRLHRAKALMVAEGLSVTEAARRVGYESTSHFSRAFKKRFHVSPKSAQTCGYRELDF